MDKKRREGGKVIKAKVAEVTNSDEMNLMQKIEQLKEGSDFYVAIKKHMENLWTSQWIYICAHD